MRSYALVTSARDLSPLHDASWEGWGLVSASGPTLSMGPLSKQSLAPARMGVGKFAGANDGRAGESASATWGNKRPY